MNINIKDRMNAPHSMMNRATRILLVVSLLVPSLSICAQTDSTKINSLSFAVNVLTHGETVHGGLPVDADAENEDRSHFLLGRTRLVVDYNRSGLTAHALIQNLAVWGTSNNKAI